MPAPAVGERPLLGKGRGAATDAEYLGLVTRVRICDTHPADGTPKA